MTNTSINLNSAQYRLDNSRPQMTLLDELLAQWEVTFRGGHYIRARLIWAQVEKARRAA